VRADDDITEVRTELQDRYGSPLPPPVEGLFDVAGLRRAMVDAGITEAATVAGNLRIRPIELEDSRQVRLQRILPGAEYRAETRTLLVPERMLPESEAVKWVTEILEQLTSSR
jgi:transcription-repair coupling factor (superfamily II helicase)